MGFWSKFGKIMGGAALAGTAVLTGGGSVGLALATGGLAGAGGSLNASHGNTPTTTGAMPVNMYTAGQDTTSTLGGLVTISPQVDVSKLSLNIDPIWIIGAVALIVIIMPRK